MENDMNNINYGVPYAPANNGEGYYAPPVQKKKGLPGMLLLILASIIGSMPASLGATLVNMLAPLFKDVENISVISTTLHTVIDAVGYIFLAAAVGGAGYLWSKSFRGSLEFLTCWKVSSLISKAVGNVLYGIAWAVFGQNIIATMGVVLSVISFIGSAIEIAFLCLSFVLFEKLIKKEESKITPAPFSYGDIAPAPKKSFNILNTIIVVAVTSVVSYVISLIQLPLYEKVVSQGQHLPSVVQYLSGAATNILVLLCLVGLSFLLTKSAKSAVSICGIFAGASLFSSAVTSFIRFVYLLITGSYAYGGYVTFNFILNICGTALAVIIAALAVSFLSKKKEFKED